MLLQLQLLLHQLFLKKTQSFLLKKAISSFLLQYPTNHKNQLYEKKFELYHRLKLYLLQKRRISSQLQLDALCNDKRNHHEVEQLQNDDQRALIKGLTRHEENDLNLNTYMLLLVMKG